MLMRVVVLVQMNGKSQRDGVEMRYWRLVWSRNTVLELQWQLEMMSINMWASYQGSRWIQIRGCVGNGVPLSFAGCVGWIREFMRMQWLKWNRAGVRIFTTMGCTQPRPPRLMCVGGCLEFSYTEGSSSGSAVKELNIPSSSRRVARVDLSRSSGLGRC